MNSNERGILDVVDTQGKPTQVLSYIEDIKKHIEVEKRIYPSTPPFLTLITRSYKKPNCLQKCLNSVDVLVDKDFEHIIYYDRKGLGLAAADQALDVFKDINRGQYIMVLDDDDILTNKNFLTIIKNIQKQYNPSIIIWRGYFTEIQYVLPPIDFRWGVQPTRALIGSFNYCCKKELYDKHIHKCTSGMSGDFDFLESAVEDISKNQIYWIKKILVSTQQKSYGRDKDIDIEEDSSKES